MGAKRIAWWCFLAAGLVTPVLGAPVAATEQLQVRDLLLADGDLKDLKVLKTEERAWIEGSDSPAYAQQVSIGTLTVEVLIARFADEKSALAAATAYAASAEHTFKTVQPGRTGSKQWNRSTPDGFANLIQLGNLCLSVDYSGKPKEGVNGDYDVAGRILDKRMQLARHLQGAQIAHEVYKDVPLKAGEIEKLEAVKLIPASPQMANMFGNKGGAPLLEQGFSLDDVRVHVYYVLYPDIEKAKAGISYYENHAGDKYEEGLWEGAEVAVIGEGTWLCVWERESTTIMVRQGTLVIHVSATHQDKQERRAACILVAGKIIEKWRAAQKAPK